MSIIKGNNLMCFVGGKSIAFATNHTLEVTGETISTSTKDNGGGEWETSEMGILSWSCSSENLLGDPRSGLGYDDLFDMMVKKQAVDLVFSLKSNISADGTYYEAPESGWTAKTNDGHKGKAYITSLSLNAPNAENSSMSVTFTGTGALTKVSTTASAGTKSVAQTQTLKA